MEVQIPNDHEPVEQREENNFNIGFAASWRFLFHLCATNINFCAFKLKMAYGLPFLFEIFIQQLYVIH